ncbi:MAG: hypothetical protein JST19_17525, partial [Bacteroidetes bacterium]|nr:hypothetical protein [Bacteroidota bacterium]
MRKTLYSLLFTVLISSCAVHNGLITNREARRNNQQVQQDNRESIANYKPMTSL